MKRFGEYIKKIIKEKGTNARELSEKSNLSMSAIYAWCRGQNIGKVETLKELVLALKLTPAEENEFWKAWSLEKSHPTLSERIEETTEESERVKEVLKTIEPEIKLKEKLEKLEIENAELGKYKQLFNLLDDATYEEVIIYLCDRFLLQEVKKNNPNIELIKEKIEEIKKKFNNE